MATNELHEIGIETARTAVVALLVATLVVGSGGHLALAGPQLQEAVEGSVTLWQPAENQFQIDASDGSIGHYSSFDIDVGERVHVEIENAGSHLARVISIDPTTIQGRLMSNGHVYLVNPAGVMITPGAVIRVAGLHAAAGRIEGFGPEGEIESLRYFDLEGAVRNLGTVTAEIVELVGQHVVQGGTLTNGGADGFFVLVVGNDVTLLRERAEDGSLLNIGVTIEGLADEVLRATGDPNAPPETRAPGIELLAGANIDAGAGGRLTAAAAVVDLGAGDLAGAAIHYMASLQQAGRATLAAEGGDVEVDGRLVATEVDLCAGSPCFSNHAFEQTPLQESAIAGGRAELDGFALREDRDPSPNRRGVRFGENADLAAESVRVLQDADLRVVEVATGMPDELPVGVLAPALRELRLQSSGDLQVASDLSARTLSLRGGADGTGDMLLAAGGEAIEIGADFLEVRAGGGKELDDPAVAEDASAIRIGENARFAGASDETEAPLEILVRQDRDIGAENVISGEQLVGEGQTRYLIQSDVRSVVVDDEMSPKLRNASWDLELKAALGVRVEAAAPDADTPTIQARRLTLHAGAETADDPGTGPLNPVPLVIGFADGVVRIHADEVILRAGEDSRSFNQEIGGFIFPPATVILDTDLRPQFRATDDGSGPPLVYTVQQDAGIGFDQFAFDLAESRGEDPDGFSEEWDLPLDFVAADERNLGPISADDVIRYTLQSNGSRVRIRLDPDDANLQPLLRVFESADLTLTTLDLPNKAAVDVLLPEDHDPADPLPVLEARSLTLHDPTSVRIETDLHASAGDLRLEGRNLFVGAATQTVRASQGRIIGRQIDGDGELAKVGGGDLLLLAGAADEGDDAAIVIDQTVEVLDGGSLEIDATHADGGTIDLNADVEVAGEGGELRLLDDFRVAADLSAVRGSIVLATSGTFDGARDDDAAIEQRVSARILEVTGGAATVIRKESGNLVLEGTESVTVGAHVSASMDGGSVLLESDELVQLLDGAALEAANVELLATGEAGEVVLGNEINATITAGDLYSFEQALDVQFGGSSDETGLRLLDPTAPAPELYVARSLHGRLDADSVPEGRSLRGLELGADEGQLTVAGELGAQQITLAGQSVVFAESARLRGTPSANLDVVTIQQTDDLDTSALSLSKVFGSVEAPLEYTLRSDGNLTVDEAFTETGAEQVDLALISRGDLSIDSDVTARSLRAEAGADGGSGALLVGVHVTPGDADTDSSITPNGTQPTLRADAISLDARRAAGAADFDGQVRIGAGVRLRGTAGGGTNPLALSIVQDADLVDATHVPDVAQFGTGNVAGLDYALRSRAGSVTLTTPGKVEGSKLTLGGAVEPVDAVPPSEDDPGVEGSLGIDVAVSGDLTLASLSVVDGGDSNPRAVFDGVSSAGDVTLFSEEDPGQRVSFAGTLEAQNVRAWSDLDFSGAGVAEASAAPTLLAREDLEVHGGILAAPVDGVSPQRLRIAAGGSLEIDGLVEMVGDEIGARVVVWAPDVTLGLVRTSSETVEGAPDILIRGFDRVTLTDDLVAESPGDLGRGDVTIVAPEVFVGTPQGAGEQGPVEGARLVGSNVEVWGLVSETDLADGTGEELRVFTVDASERARMADSLAIDEVQISSQGDVILDGAAIAASVVSLAAGTDGSGTLFLNGDEIRADTIELRAGSDAEDAEISRVELGTVRLSGAGAGTPDTVELSQDAGIDSASARELLSHITDPGPGLGLGLLSFQQQVQVATEDGQGALFQGMRLVLGGAEQLDGAGEQVRTVTVDGDLDVESLELRSAARIEGGVHAAAGLSADGDLEVAGSATDPELGIRVDLGDAQFGGDVTVESGGILIGRGGARFGGDVTIERGDAEVHGVTRFSALADQKLEVRAGGFTTLAVRASPSVEEDQTADLTLVTAGDIELSGSVEGAPEGELMAARVIGGALVLRPGGEIRLGGNVIARDDVELGLGPVNVSLDGVRDQTLLSEDGTIRGEADLIKRAHSCESADGCADRLLPEEYTSLTLGGLFDLGGDIVAQQDLVIAGRGTLRGDDTRSMIAEDGRLVFSALVDGIDASGVVSTAPRLVLSAGDGIETFGVGADDEVLVSGSDVEIRSDVRGSGSLTVDVTGAGAAGRMTLLGDVELDPGAALELLSEAEQGVVFGALGQEREGAQEIRAGNVRINPLGRDGAESATIVAWNDLQIEASAGSVEVGAGEIVTVLGDLELVATDSVALPQLNAFAIDARAPRVFAVSAGDGADWNANSVRIAGEPGARGGGHFVVGTPTAQEVSGNLVNGELLLRALKPSLRPLLAGDLLADGVALDFTPTGSARFESGEHFDTPVVEVAPLSSQALAHLNEIGADRRPLIADELYSFLSSAAVGGQVARGARVDDPRLASEGVEGALSVYRGLFAPVAHFDPGTGGNLVRSHAPRIRETLAAAFDGFRARGLPLEHASFVAYLQVDRRQGEALFYVLNMRDLVSEALAGGLDRSQQKRFARLLAADVTPDGMPVELLANAILPE